MSWYSTVHEPTRQMNALLETNPTLSSLLTYPDFIKYFETNSNPNLQYYLENSPNIPNQIVTFISVPPTEADTIDRKHKLPLATLQMLEGKNQWVHKLLYRTTKQNNICFLAMFDMFRTGKEVLPLLGGYFSRVSTVFCRHYKQALNLIYSSPQYLQFLIGHSYDQSIARTLKQYLSIDLINIVILSTEQATMKLNMIRYILQKIQIQRKSGEYKSILIVGNLLDFLREEILQKYNIIHHGKEMVEIILTQRYINTIMGLILQQSQNSLPAIKLVFMCLRYYAFSCFKLHEKQPDQQLKQRIERIQNEPFIRKLLTQFKVMVQKAKNQKTINLYSYNILNVLCHTIKLPMNKIFNAFKQSALIPILIDLLFQYQNCNILHKLIEGLFEELFTTENKMYDQYKEYLFCHVSIIDLTAIRLYKLFPEVDGYQKARKKGYFGPLIQIIKKYSTIMAHTTNPQIKSKINASTDICQKFSQKIMMPHENICKNSLGEYENVPKTVPIQYTSKKIGNQLVSRPQNTEAVEQVKKQQEGMTKLLQAVIDSTSYNERKSYDDSDSFYKSPLEDLMNKNIEKPKIQNGLNYQPVFNEATTPQANKQKQSFSEVMAKLKVQVGQQNKEKKSQSLQKRLSADKRTRLTSPSPNKKKNSWKQQPQQQKNQQKAPNKIPLVNRIPIPIPSLNTHSAIYSTNPANNNHNLAKSSVHQTKKTFQQQSKRVLSLSTANLQSLRKTTIIRTTQQPTEKKFRKVQEKDKALFAYLGINC